MKTLKQTKIAISQLNEISDEMWTPIREKGDIMRKGSDAFDRSETLRKVIANLLLYILIFILGIFLSIKCITNNVTWLYVICGVAVFGPILKIGITWYIDQQDVKNYLNAEVEIDILRSKQNILDDIVDSEEKILIVHKKLLKTQSINKLIKKKYPKAKWFYENYGLLVRSQVYVFGISNDIYTCGFFYLKFELDYIYIIYDLYYPTEYFRLPTDGVR